VLSVFVVRFMSYVDNAKLAAKSKSYLRNGWRLLEQTGIASMKMDRITAEDVDALAFPGGPYNINCALKTLRRMLHKAEEWELIAKAPKLKLMKELGRTLRLDQEAERELLAAADRLLESGKWTPKITPLSATWLFSSGIPGCATRKSSFVRASRTWIGTTVCFSFPIAKPKTAGGSFHSAIAFWISEGSLRGTARGLDLHSLLSFGTFDNRGQKIPGRQT
jgi:hypothetical protein